MSRPVNRRPRDPLSRVPPSLRAAWGVRAEPGRGPRPALTLTRIVDAAAGVAAHEGLDAVSMNRVAQALDVGTMSLYRYVKGKEELLALMADHVFAEAPEPRGARESWRAALARWARSHRAVLQRHAWVLGIPLSGPPITPHHVVWFERGLACLANTGLAESDKLWVLLLVNGFVRNEARMAAEIRAARRSVRGANALIADYDAVLGALIDADRFPALTALRAARVFEGREGPNAEFDFGLERILDGVAVLVRER